MKTISVVAAVAELDGHFFIARRRAGKAQAGKWEFPGGKLEADEKPDQALVRELKEELNIDAEVLDFIASGVHDYGDLKIELLAFAVNFKNYEFRLSDHDEWRWVIPEELVEYDFSAADEFIVKHLQTGLKEDIC